MTIHVHHGRWLLLLKVKYMLTFVVAHVAERAAAASTKMRVHLLRRTFKIKRKAPDNPSGLQTRSHSAIYPTWVKVGHASLCRA